MGRGKRDIRDKRRGLTSGGSDDEASSLLLDGGLGGLDSDAEVALSKRGDLGDGALVDEVVLVLLGRDRALAVEADPAGALGDLGSVLAGILIDAGADVADARDLHPGALGHLTLDEELDVGSLDGESKISNKRGVDISTLSDGHGRNSDALNLDDVSAGITAVGEGEGDGVKGLKRLGHGREAGKVVHEHGLGAADRRQKHKSNDGLHVNNN